jgi:hypothetical protein
VYDHRSAKRRKSSLFFDERAFRGGKAFLDEAEKLVQRWQQGICA